MKSGVNKNPVQLKMLLTPRFIEVGVEINKLGIIKVFLINLAGILFAAVYYDLLGELSR
ncbi:MAG: hypothetical protein KAX28_09800 [Candidatus Marinimicrobia bacterium]|nr:hypothetical protein [Candidatus Neomarinimicrobiota bacterium]